MHMKDRKAFDSDEAYLAYCWSLKPDDWSDEDWQEYLEGRLMRLAAIQENYKKCGKPEEDIGQI